MVCGRRGSQQLLTCCCRCRDVILGIVHVILNEIAQGDAYLIWHVQADRNGEEGERGLAQPGVFLVDDVAAAVIHRIDVIVIGGGGRRPAVAGILGRGRAWGGRAHLMVFGRMILLNDRRRRDEECVV